MPLDRTNLSDPDAKPTDEPLEGPRRSLGSLRVRDVSVLDPLQQDGEPAAHVCHSLAMLIAQIVFDDFTDLDVFCAWDLLNRVRRPGWTVQLLGTESHHTSKSGLTIPMHGTLEAARAADAVLFASGPRSAALAHDAAYLARFQLDPTRQLVGAMCSGALILAGLGLLAGKRATTYPTAVAALERMGVTVVPEPFVRSGNIATAAACLAGVDLAGWVIETLLDSAERDRVLAEIAPVQS